MSLFEVVLNSSYVGQNCVNRWNYVGGGVAGAVTPSFALASALGAIYDDTAIPPAYPADSFLDLLTTCQAAGAVLQQITVLNVYDPVDFYQTAFVPPYAGQQSGDGAPPFVAMGFRTNIVNRDIGRGYKRLVGIPDGAETAAGAISSGHQTVMRDFADKMGEILEYDDEGNTLTFSPAVCQKQKLVQAPPLTPPIKIKYFDTLAEQMEHTVTGIAWEIYTQVRSQTSRQYGRGS